MVKAQEEKYRKQVSSCALIPVEKANQKNLQDKT